MHIEKLPNGHFRAAVAFNGQRRSVTRPTRGEVRYAGAELLIEMGGNPSEGTSTVGELVAGHLAQVAGKWSPTTHDDMKRVANRIPESFADRSVRSITPALLASLYRQLERDGWSAHRIKRAHTLLSVAFAGAVVYGWMRVNPCRDIAPPTPEKAAVKPPSTSAVKAIMRHADPRLHTFLMVAHNTGARRGEIVALRWDDINFDAGTIAITRSLAQRVGDAAVVRPTKTGAKGHRTLTLDLPTAAALRKHRAAEVADALHDGDDSPAWVFSHDNGRTPWRPDYVSRLFADARKAAKVDGVRLHDIRHYVATTMLQDREAAIDVAAQLGHASVATTLSVYSHYIPGRGKEAADRRAARLMAE